MNIGNIPFHIWNILPKSEPQIKCWTEQWTDHIYVWVVQDFVICDRWLLRAGPAGHQQYPCLDWYAHPLGNNHKNVCNCTLRAPLLCLMCFSPALGWVTLGGIEPGLAEIYNPNWIKRLTRLVLPHGLVLSYAFVYGFIAPFCVLIGSWFQCWCERFCAAQMYTQI